MENLKRRWEQKIRKPEEKGGLSEKEFEGLVEEKLRGAIRGWAWTKKEVKGLRQIFGKGKFLELAAKDRQLKEISKIYIRFRLEQEGLKKGPREYEIRYNEISKEIEKGKENALKDIEERPIRTHTNYGREVIENLQPKENETFVDVGCGAGIQTIMAGQEKAKAIGVDFNRGNVKFANKLAKLTELIFSDKKFTENFISLFEKKIVKYGDKQLSEKAMEVFSKINKEFSLLEKEKVKGELLDLMPYIFDLYEFYLELKWKDPYLDEKLKKTELPKNVSFIHGDAVHLPLKSNFADKILSADVINWIPEENQKNVLEEILEIAKNGALLEVFPAPNFKKLAEEKNIRLEEVGREKVGLGKKLGLYPIYRAIKSEKE